MKINRRRTNTTKLEKISGFFFDLAWKGGVVGFFLVLILNLVEVFSPEIKDATISISCFAFLTTFFMFNLSVFFATEFLINLRAVRNKQETKRIGLEQAFIDMVGVLFCWWVIYWILGELL